MTAAPRVMIGNRNTRRDTDFVPNDRSAGRQVADWHWLLGEEKCRFPSLQVVVFISPILCWIPRAGL